MTDDQQDALQTAALWAPAPLAETVQLLELAEDDDAVRLRVVDCFRASLFLMTSIAHAARVSQGPPPIGDRPRIAELRERLRQRNLMDGQWWELFRELLTPYVSDPTTHLVPELVHLLRGAQKKRTNKNIDAFLKLRRDLAHGVGEPMLPDAARALLAAHLLMVQPFWKAYQIVVPHTNAQVDAPTQSCWRLVGLPYGGRYKTIRVDKGSVSTLPVHEPMLATSGGKVRLSLAPLLRFVELGPSSAHSLVCFEGAKSKLPLYCSLVTQDKHVWPDWRELDVAVFPLQESGELHGDVEPYRGERPYLGEHRDLFFGRDHEAEAVLNHVREGESVVLTGLGGVGKTSLLRAAIIPQLIDEDYAIIAMRASEDPFAKLITAVQRSLGQWLEDQSQTVDWTTRSAQLGLVLHRFVEDTGRRVVVVVDQCCDLLRDGVDPTSLNQLYEALASVEGEKGRSLLLVMRDWAVVPLKSGALKGVALTRVRLGAIQSEELKEVLFEPASAAGVRFDFKALDEIANALYPTEQRAPELLPVLQICAAEMWKQRDRRLLRIDDDVLARVGGVFGPFCAAASRAFEHLNPGERAEAKRILRTLVEQAAGIPVSEVVRANAVTALSELVRARVVVEVEGEGETGEGGAWVRLITPRLVEHWTRLADWLEDEPADEADARMLREALTVWVRSEEAASALLDREATLRARLWLERNATRASDDEKRFVAASVRAHKNRRRARWALVTAFCVLGTIISMVFATQWQDAEANARRIDRLLQLQKVNTLMFKGAAEVAADKPAQGLALLRAAASAADALPLTGEDGRPLTDAGKVVVLQEEAWRELGERATALVPRVLGEGEMWTGLAYSETGLVAVAGRQGGGRVWRADTGQVVAELDTPPGMDGLAFSGDGNDLVGWTVGRTEVRHWVASSWEAPPAKLLVPSGEGIADISLARGAGGNDALFSTQQGTVGRIDLVRGMSVGDFVEAPEPEPLGTRMTAHGDWAVWVYRDRVAAMHPGDADVAWIALPDPVAGKGLRVEQLFLDSGRWLYLPVRRGDRWDLATVDLVAGEVVPEAAAEPSERHTSAILQVMGAAPGGVLSLSAQQVILRRHGARIVMSVDEQKLRRAAVSVDGRYVAAVAEATGMPVHVWRVGRTAKLQTLPRPDTGTAALQFSSTHNQLVTAGTGVQLWDLDSKVRWLVHDGDVQAAALSSDGRLAVASATAPGGASLHLWDVAREAPATPPMLTDAAPVRRAVAFLPATEIAVVVDSHCRVWFVDPTGAEVVEPGFACDIGRSVVSTTARAKNFTGSVAVSPDGAWVASQAQNAVLLIDARSRTLARVLRGAHAEEMVQPTVDQRWNNVRSLAFSDDGALLASGDDNGLVVVWDVTTRREASHQQIHSQTPVFGLHLLDGGERILSRGADRMLHCTVVKTGRACWEPFGGQSGGPKLVDVSADGAWLAVQHEAGIAIARTADRSGWTFRQDLARLPIITEFVGNHASLIAADTSGAIVRWGWDEPSQSWRFLRAIEGIDARPVWMETSADGEWLLVAGGKEVRVAPIALDWSNRTSLGITGSKTNRRPCRRDFRTIPAVSPFPESDTVWAPEDLCLAQNLVPTLESSSDRAVSKAP